MAERRRAPPPPAWMFLALLKMFSLALAEALWGLLTWPFVRRLEIPQLSYISTATNRALIEGNHALTNGYDPSPWSTGPNAQTLFGIIKLGANPKPRKESIIMSDGVAISLLWFEPEGVKPDAPCVVSLHGIGGDENSVRPIMLAEECLKRGWRSVMYLRRGHGDSSLLPVAATVTPDETHEAMEVAVGAGDVEAPAVAAGETQSPLYAGPSAAAADTAAADTAAAEHPAGRRSFNGSAADATPAPTGTATPTTTVATATDGIASTAGGVRASASTSSLDSLVNCLPRNLATAIQRGNAAPSGGGHVSPKQPGTPTLPSFSAPPIAHTFSTAGVGCLRTAPPRPPVVVLDPEALRSTRKAFPQHADTEDFQAVLQHVHKTHPAAPLVAVGFSMGSNVLVKFLGEVNDTENNPLAGAVSICNGYDIVEGTRHMVNHRPLADRVITASLHKLLRRKLPEVHAICKAHGLLVDFDEVLACNTIREFERALMLPICGDADLDAYYNNNNCKEALQHVATPLLCMSSLDDPIIDPSLLYLAKEAAASNPNVLLAVTKRGGHLGWMQGWRGTSWMMDVIMEYVEAITKLVPEPAAPVAQHRVSQSGKAGAASAPVAAGAPKAGSSAVGKAASGQDLELAVQISASSASTPPAASAPPVASMPSAEATVAAASTVATAAAARDVAVVEVTVMKSEEEPGTRQHGGGGASGSGSSYGGGGGGGGEAAGRGETGVLGLAEVVVQMAI